MSLVPVTAPTVAPVTLPDLQAHLNLEEINLLPGDLPLLDIYLTAAVEMVDGPTGRLDMALVTQTWDLKLEGFPGGATAIELPLPPLQSVTSISYVDPDGAPQTVASYQVFGVGYPFKKGRVEPAVGASWPTTRVQDEAVTIRFVAGYGGEPNNVPARLRRAILMIAAEGFRYREAGLPPAEVVQSLPIVDNLLADYRSRWFA